MRIISASLFALAFAPAVMVAQIGRDSTQKSPSPTPESVVEVAKAEQKFFEDFRRLHLPVLPKGHFNPCFEKVGRLCYWYDENAAPFPKELPQVTRRRELLLIKLDSLGKINPEDPWIAGQRIRYLGEIEKFDDALRVAKGCEDTGPACDLLVGFSLHMLGRYASADSAFLVAQDKMDPGSRCEFRNINDLIDTDTRADYRAFKCGDPRREAFEDRVWFLSRVLYSRPGNDSRTEFYSREVMAVMIGDAENLYPWGFDADEQEMLMRYGWIRTWAAGAMRPLEGLTIDVGVAGQGGSSIPAGAKSNAGGLEPMPAYRMIPAQTTLTNPATSDTVGWGLQYSPVIARYAPPYAKTMRAFDHQLAKFRRGDSALVVLAYDARTVKEFNGVPVNAALVVTSVGPIPHEYIARAVTTTGTGYFTVKAPWEPLLLSVEAAAPERKTAARSRYGLEHFVMPDDRVTLSDLLLYTPYGTPPASAEEAAPHALFSDKVRANEKLGVFWEAYNTDPNGEKMSITLTVVRELTEDGILQKLAKSVGLKRQATPVSVSVEDISARGSKTSPRAIDLNIATLSKGSYIVELEIELAGQVVMRSDHHIEVISP